MISVAIVEREKNGTTCGEALGPDQSFDLCVLMLSSETMQAVESYRAGQYVSYWDQLFYMQILANCTPSLSRAILLFASTTGFIF